MSCARYHDSADSWTLKALALTSLGEHWHPVGTPMVLDALKSRDRRLVAFGLEALYRTRADVLRAVATPDLIEELIDHTSRTRVQLVKDRALAVLERLAPDASASDRGDWKSWWRQHRRDWAPAEWPALPKPDGEKPAQTTTAPILERAIDLRDAGLDLVICIDTTGSMGGPMAATRDAIGGIVALLGGIAPHFRAGLVQYRDLGDLSGGADVMVPLTRNADSVRDKLDHTHAGGGGDPPEAVDAGLERSLGRDVGWNPRANKLILLIGDAPPHENKLDHAVDLSRTAHADPASEFGGGPITGKHAGEIRPFVISAIAIRPEALSSFQEIARAGGGVCVKMFPDARSGGSGAADGGARTIVEHVLSMSFGEQWRAQVEDFVRTWFAYHDAGFFS